MDGPAPATTWPALPYDEWRPTRDTLHLYTQVLGKLRLALSPFEPQWAHVPLYVTARGLTTSTLPVDGRTCDVELDLLEHCVVIRTSDGKGARRPLGGSVAAFYRHVVEGLGEVGVSVDISLTPSEIPDPIPFPDDTVHDTYEPAHASRFFAALTQVDTVLKEHHARFRGRTTPVQFFWGTFDLAITRYSGRRVDPPEGAGVIASLGADAEEVCAGWWPGDERHPEPAFYAYAYPAPDGVDRIEVRPQDAAWDPRLGEFVLSYDAARSAAEPRRAVLDFLESTYGGAARLLGWPADLTDVHPPRRARRA